MWSGLGFENGGNTGGVAFVYHSEPSDKQAREARKKPERRERRKNTKVEEKKETQAAKVWNQKVSSLVSKESPEYRLRRGRVRDRCHRSHPRSATAWRHQVNRSRATRTSPRHIPRGFSGVYMVVAVAVARAAGLGLTPG